MSSFIIFDTSIFIDQLRTARHQKRVESVTGLIRMSAVVLSELWRGVTLPAERRFLRSLERNHPVLIPRSRNWLESGEILSKVGIKRGFAAEKLPDLHFDVLIALTARSYGARLITSNLAAFEAIAEYVPVRVEVWP